MSIWERQSLALGNFGAFRAVRNPRHRRKMPASSGTWASKGIPVCQLNLNERTKGTTCIYRHLMLSLKFCLSRTTRDPKGYFCSPSPLTLYDSYQHKLHLYQRFSIKTSLSIPSSTTLFQPQTLSHHQPQHNLPSPISLLPFPHTHHPNPP